MPASILPQLLKLIVALPLVIILAYISLRMTDKYIYKQKQRKNIQIIDRLPVSNKSSICIVKILDEYMVVGISENGFDVIKKLTQAELEAINKEADPEKGINDSFMVNIKKLLKGKQNYD